MSRRPETRLAYSTEAGPAPEHRGRGREKRNAAPPAATGKGIRLRLDRRASDRVVTTISGLPGSREAVAELARLLRGACGTGGTLKNGVVELQGDHRERVEAFLAERGLKSKRAGG